MLHSVTFEVDTTRVDDFQSETINFIRNNIICTDFSPQLENGSQPACFTKDLRMRIYSRDSKPSAPRSILSFFTGQKQNPQE